MYSQPRCMARPLTRCECDPFCCFPAARIAPIWPFPPRLTPSPYLLALLPCHTSSYPQFNFSPCPPPRPKPNPLARPPPSTPQVRVPAGTADTLAPIPLDPTPSPHPSHPTILTLSAHLPRYLPFPTPHPTGSGSCRHRRQHPPGLPQLARPPGQCRRSQRCGRHAPSGFN